MKLDLRKAYDSVEWSFLQQVMLAFGFPAEFVEKVMLCISTAQYSILINGTPFGYFKGCRGLRQGDPISPYLFVIGMEYLSRLLKQLAEDPQFSFHQHCKSLRLNHLLFADDLMMFSKADYYSTMALKRNFEKFSKASGLQVNNEKSQVLVSGVPEATQNSIINNVRLC